MQIGIIKRIEINLNKENFMILVKFETLFLKKSKYENNLCKIWYNQVIYFIIYIRVEM